MTRFLIALLLSLSLAGNAFAAMYKWVDKEGNVHYGDCPPADQKCEQIKKEPGPSEEAIKRAQERTEWLIQEQKQREADRKKEIEQKAAGQKQTDASKQKKPLSLEELNRRCEEAREKKIAPLREAAIKECINNPNLREANPEEYCRRFYEDYGQGTVRYGKWGKPKRTPGMFYDLPECVEAFEAWKKRKTAR